MNYFELYGFPLSFRVDQAVLKKQFYALSRQYHPDFFTRSGAAEQAEVLEKAAMVNRAYKTFSTEDGTMQYLLELKGMIEPEEKFQLDPIFLAEVMEINEGLMELEMDPEMQALAARENETHKLLKIIYDEVEPVLANYQEGTTTEKELLQVKEYYYRKKYLKRILDKIASLRNIASRNSEE